MTGRRWIACAAVKRAAAGASVSAVYPPTGFVDPSFPCLPLAVNANFCANATPFNANRIDAPRPTGSSWWRMLTHGLVTLASVTPLLLPGPTGYAQGRECY